MKKKKITADTVIEPNICFDVHRLQARFQSPFVSRPLQCLLLLPKGVTACVHAEASICIETVYTVIVADKSKPKQTERAPLSVMLFLYKSCFWLFLCNRNHYKVSGLSYPHWHIKSHVLVQVFCEPISSPFDFDLETVGTRQFCVGLSVLTARGPFLSFLSLSYTSGLRPSLL